MPPGVSRSGGFSGRIWRALCIVADGLVMIIATRDLWRGVSEDMAGKLGYRREWMYVREEQKR